MTGTTFAATHTPSRSWLDRSLSIFADVRAGEGATAVLMLINVFLLLICYSVIKTVREPLILLGGGAEVRSYAAAGQALLLMGFVPVYSWFASRVNRARLLVGVTLFFIICIELFAAAVAARVPYVGVAFFIWVGIFNMSLVAQFWSFANDIYSKDAGARLFPIIMIGMTAGAPIGAIVAGRLFRLGITPQVILQVSALLLGVSVGLYLLINRRVSAKAVLADAPLSAGNGFKLVLANRYLALVAALIVLLNIVNTTGEYMVARLLTLHVKELAMLNPQFNKQAFIGAFTGDYQFWVGVTAFFLQAFVASRLVKYRGLAGVLFALPLIALGGYAIIAAGVGFSVVRWIKTAENATDYSIMNTARQLLWLPTTREEKYKAKQAIDTFFVRGGDVLSAGMVFAGTQVLHLTVPQFAMVNIVLTAIWIGLALVLIKPVAMPRLMPRRAAAAGLAAVLAVLFAGSPASAQETREAQLAAERAAKATRLYPPTPTQLEKKIARVTGPFMSEKPFYLRMGGPIDGAGLSLGPGYRMRFGDTGTFDTHATMSIRNVKGAEATVGLPRFANDRVSIDTHARWFDAPGVAFYGIGNNSSRDNRDGFLYKNTTVGAATTMEMAPHLSVGGAFDLMRLEADAVPGDTSIATTPTYQRTGAFARLDFRNSPGYTRRGSLAQVEVADYRQRNGHDANFRRIDAEVQHYVPMRHENLVLAFRALASTTETSGDSDVPYFLLPDLGGSDNLRGFSAWRFRDRHRMLMTAEYRWMASPLLDMAIFADAGKVASRRADLNFDGLKVSEGVGLRVHTPASTVTRIELARSKEGLSLIVAFSPSF